MIKINEDLLIDDLCSTALAFSLCTNNDFVKNNYGNFVLLNNTLYHNFDKMVFCDDLINHDYCCKLVGKENDRSIGDFALFFYRNHDYFIEIADNFGKILRDIKFYTYPFFNNIRKYSEKDFKDIILGYYSTFGNDYYKIAKRYFDEGRIHLGEENPDEEYSGCFKKLQWLNSGYVFSKSDQYNSTNAGVVVHELGHAVNAERFLFPQQKKIASFGDCLKEVPSTTFEHGFYDYLIDNHIDIDGGRISKNMETFWNNEYLEELAYASMEDDFYICEDGFAETDNGEEYALRDDILYGIGRYISLHLNQIRKNDKKEFLKVLNNLITLRKEMTFPQAIDCTGFSLDDFISGKYIKPEIEENSLELRKRYKY